MLIMVIRHPERSEHEGIHQFVSSVVNEIHGGLWSTSNQPNVSERIDDRSPRTVVIRTGSAVGTFLYKNQAQPICFRASSAFHTLLMLTILSPSKCMM